jgi:hypothetical protein
MHTQKAVKNILMTTPRVDSTYVLNICSKMRIRRERRGRPSPRRRAAHRPGGLACWHASDKRAAGPDGVVENTEDQQRGAFVSNLERLVSLSPEDQALVKAMFLRWREACLSYRQTPGAGQA